jgi:hypothetical protein
VRFKEESASALEGGGAGRACGERVLFAQDGLSDRMRRRGKCSEDIGGGRATNGGARRLEKKGVRLKVVETYCTIVGLLETARMSYEPRRLRGNAQKVRRRELGEGRQGKTAASKENDETSARRRRLEGVQVLDGTLSGSIQRRRRRDRGLRCECGEG